jgi:gamma-glutamylputrescine oxidase
MNTTQHAASYYAASANDTRIRPALVGHEQADVCVIGAGFTGLSSALHLAEQGYKVIVLEASRIGFGASGRNGGQIVHSYSRDMDFIEKHYGQDTASALGAMAFEGGQIIRDFVKRYDIRCDLKDGGIFAACSQSQLDDLVAKKRLWEQYGHRQLEMLDADSIRHHIGSERYTGGLLDKSGGHFHPLNLVLGEAAALESLGGVIYEGSRVLRVEQGDKVRLHTEQGCVSAHQVVVAGNAYLGGLIPQLEQKAMPCGSQVLATEPLSRQLQQALLPQDQCVEDCNYLLDYYRLSGDGRLIYGGGVTYGARAPGRIEQLIRPNMLKTFAQLAGTRIDFAWTGNFLLTLMRLPQFGRIGSNLYYAQGYSGHGIASSHLAGRLICDAIRGQSERFDVFAGLPQTRFPGGRLLRVPLTAMGAWYYSLRDRLGV